MVARVSTQAMAPLAPDVASARSRIIDLLSLAIADGFVSPEELALIHERGRDLGLTADHINEIIANPHRVTFVEPATVPDAIVRLYDLAKVLLSDGSIDPREVDVMRSFARRFRIPSHLVSDVVAALVDEVRAGTTREALVAALTKELES